MRRTVIRCLLLALGIAVSLLICGLTRFEAIAGGFWSLNDGEHDPTHASSPHRFFLVDSTTSFHADDTATTSPVVSAPTAEVATTGSSTARGPLAEAPSSMAAATAADDARSRMKGGEEEEEEVKIGFTWVRPSAKEARGSPVKYVGAIKMPTEYPCATLLQCAHWFVKRVNQTRARREGLVLLATGTGKLVQAVFSQKGDDHGWIPYLAHAALRITRPTIFLIMMWDFDPLAKHYWRFVRGVREEPYATLYAFPAWFHLVTCAEVDREGRIARGTIPLPHFLGRKNYPKAMEFSPALLPQNLYKLSYVDRPRAVMWRGTTTGGGQRLYLNLTDRGRTLAFFHRHSNISNVFATKNYQGGYLPDSWLRPMAKGPHAWLKGGRILLDVDGFSNAWDGLRWKLTAGGPVLKVNSTIRNVQWYYHMLRAGEHLWLVDINEPEELLRAKIDAMLDNATGAEVLVENAMRFALQHLTRHAVRVYTIEALANCWENVDEWGQRDWRIRGAS